MCDYNKLKNNINNWIEINESIAKFNTKLKTIKEKREVLEKSILSDLKNNKLTDKKFRIENNHIFYNQSTSMPTLSINLLETVLDKLVNQNTKNVILNEIKTYRENNKTTNISLKKKKIRKGTMRKSFK